MVRKTRKHKKSEKGIYSIPELRRSFEHIEAYLNDKIQKKESKEKMIRDVRKEWQEVFMKPLDHASAEALIEDRMKLAPSRRKTRRHHGGAFAITGAPVDSTTRPGLYLAPGGLPDQNGGLPLSVGNQSGGAYGSFVQYVSNGFTHPEMSIVSDPVKGQTTWPIPYSDTGSNAFAPLKGGRRRTRRGVRRGGSLASMWENLTTRPIPSSSPAIPLQDAQDMWHGKVVGSSPDQVQRGADYLLGATYPKPVTM